MLRKLNKKEIEDIIDFIQPNPNIPEDSAAAIVENAKIRMRSQLKDQMVYPCIIPTLKKELEKTYYRSFIQAGESVGVICAQSIGEKQTQTTLNSVDWKEKILFNRDGATNVSPIGKMIDTLLEKNKDKIQHIEENRTQYLKLGEGYTIPSCDMNGNCSWYKIEAVTKHLPVGKLVHVKTASGRSVKATQAKSFLVWKDGRFHSTLGSDIKVGDVVPTTISLQKPETKEEFFHLQSIFSKKDYLYTTEIKKILKLRESGEKFFGKKSFAERNGKDFTVPYKRYDTMMGKRKEYFQSCKPGLVYIHTSNEFVSHIPEKIPLDRAFGFLIGIYLADGWATKTFIGVSNNCPKIRGIVQEFCDRYGITYHTVFSSSKNVRNGKTTDLKIHSTLLARMFLAICNTGSEKKKVPDFCYTAPKLFLEGLFDGYFSGDGTVNKKDGSIIASSASQDLILGFSFLASYFGVFGKQSVVNLKKNNVGSLNIKKSYTLRISNGFAQKFAKAFTLTAEEKNKRLKEITLAKNYRYKKGISQEKFPERDVFFDKVVSVEYVEGSTEFVYDLTVEKTRNFQLWNGLNQRDTFHKAGQSEKTMTSGVPRFQELINATKKPRIVNHKIYTKKPCNSIEEIREYCGHRIIGLTLKDLSKNIDIRIQKGDEKWYNLFRDIYNDRFDKYNEYICIKLDLDKLYRYKITLKNIAEKIESEYEDLACVFSPLHIGELHIYVDTTEIVLPQDRILFVDSDNATEIYMEECVKDNLEKLNLFGVRGINEIFFTNENEWFIETNGINSREISTRFVNFKELLSLDIVDEFKTLSNNVWDIYEVLGIEAARQFLIDEFMSIMEGINLCHSSLLVDRMTFGGTIYSITRYTMKKAENGPFGKASFEETMDNFINAAARGEIEPTRGVSASIMCGKRAMIGTGMFGLQLDLNKIMSI